MIKEEESILKSCSNEDEIESEFSVLSNTDNLSQNEVNISPSNLNISSTTRSNSRVTFATMLPSQRFSPPPYHTDQSPSPASTTSGGLNTDVPKTHPDISPQTQIFRPIIRPIFRENFPPNQPATSQPLFAANHLHITPYTVPHPNHFPLVQQPTTTTRLHRVIHQPFHYPEPNKPRIPSNTLHNPKVAPSSFGLNKDHSLMEQQIHQNYFQKPPPEINQIKPDSNHTGVFNIQPWLTMNSQSNINPNNLASSQIGTNQTGFQQSTNRPTLIQNNSNIFIKSQHHDQLSQSPVVSSPVQHHPQTNMIGNLVNGVNLSQSNHVFTTSK